MGSPNFMTGPLEYPPMGHFTARRALIFLLVPMIFAAKTGLPGFSALGVDPKLNLKLSRHATVVVGPARNPTPPDAAFVMVPMGQGGEMMPVPKGAYHYSDRTAGVGANFKIPDSGQLFDVSGNYQSNNKNMNGIYFPLPFGMDPVNIQFLTEDNRGTEVESDMGQMEAVQAALESAKRACRDEANEECDQKLRYYYRVRSEQLNERESKASLADQLLSLGEMIGGSKMGEKRRHGVGMLIGMPGIEPTYVGGFMDKQTVDKFKLDR